MILASDLKEGFAVQLDGKPYKVLEVVRHAGSGQMHGFIELKLRDLRYGHFADRRFKHTDKLEEIELSKRQMDFLYTDGESFFFMDPVSFEQFGVSKAAVGTIAKFLKEGAKATVELIGEEAISVHFPKVVELKVTMTGPGTHEGQDNTMKPAELENGLEIMVPQFIVTGDIVRVDTEKVKYIDRLTTKKI